MQFSYKETVNFYEMLRVSLIYNPINTRELTLFGALQFIQFHQYKQAIITLKRVLELDEMLIDAWFWLAMCYCHINDYLSALKIINEALKLDPCRADCLSLKAYILWDEEETSTCLDCLKEAIFSAPFWPMLHLELSSFQFTIGHFEEALQQVNKAKVLIQLSPIRPNNPVEEYYEKWVTGRSWVNLEERLIDLQSKIELRLRSLLYEKF